MDINESEPGKKSNELDNFMSPLIVKPLYTLAQWRHPKTRGGRLALFIVLPTGCLDRENGIHAELENAERLTVTFCWPSILLQAEEIMKAVCSFCSDINDGQGPLLAQGLRDFTDPLQTQEGQDIYSKCVINLPFPVKPDFTEDVLKFDSKDSTTLYMLRFEAFEQNFSVPKKRLIIRTIKPGNLMPENSTAHTAGANDNTVSENSAPTTSAVTRMETK